MDAASRIKSFLVAMTASFGMATVVNGDDSVTAVPCNIKQCHTVAGVTTPCADGVCCAGQVCTAGNCPTNKSDEPCESASSKSGIVAFVSEWLSKSPKFSADVAIHFGSPLSQEKVRYLPVDGYAQNGATGRFSVGGTVHSDLGVAGEFILAEPSFNLLRAPSDSEGGTRVVPQIAKPMRFTERIPRIQLSELIGDVIICGHRICSGNKCYDVKDEPVAGTACDKTQDSNATENSEEEQILILPIAPPAPPGAEYAFYGNENAETEAASLLRSSGLGDVKISVPVTTVVDLLVAKTELSTRLEMTSQLMDERQTAAQQIQSLANRNATLATQLAVAEARNQMSEALTASVVDRAEIAIKLASTESKSGKLQNSGNLVQTIQEDLSNIRRQIALLKRSPVPFAQSYVGSQISQQYIPTAQLPGTQMPKDNEATCAGDSTECPPATTIK